MIYKINIDGYGELPVTPSFAPRVEILRRPNGVVYSTRHIWAFDGILPVDRALGEQGLIDERNALLAAFQQSQVAIQFTGDGAVIEEINPATHVNGAFFRNFDVVASGGEWVNLLKYKFEVFGNKPVAVSGIIDATTTIRVDDNNGKVTTTTEVRASGPNAALYVDSQRPARTTRSSILTSVEDQTARGSFVVEAADDDDAEGGSIDIEESVSCESGIFPAEFVRGTRTENPQVFYSSRVTTRIRISGRVSIRGRAPLVPPLSERFAKFLTARPRLGRAVEERDASGADRRESLTYEMNFEMNEPITIDEVLAERRAIAVQTYQRKEGEPGGVYVAEIEKQQPEIKGLVFPERK